MERPRFDGAFCSVGTDASKSVLKPPRSKHLNRFGSWNEPFRCRNESSRNQDDPFEFHNQTEERHTDLALVVCDYNRPRHPTYCRMAMTSRVTKSPFHP